MEDKKKNERQTFVPKRGRGAQAAKKIKRSSSFEDQSRQTLIQEMIAHTPLIKEEKEGDESD